MRKHFQIGLEELRMCTLPMYETMKDRSVKRFSYCLVASALACQFLQFLFVVCFVFPQSLTKGGLSFWHIFKECSKSTFPFLSSGVFLHYAEMTCSFPSLFQLLLFQVSSLFSCSLLHSALCLSASTDPACPPTSRHWGPEGMGINSGL